ncbi:MAG: hypothetical protein KGL34_09085, partial [Gammaproteobacteria bacterium]|nr:hypothetical protein [Gammaproteobacteria bacterium]
RIGAPAPDSDEELELEWVDLEVAVQRVLQGEIDDGKTGVALLRAQHRRATVTQSKFSPAQT